MIVSREIKGRYAHPRRFTIYDDELLVITPHKAGSRHVKTSLAAIYNCTSRKILEEMNQCVSNDMSSKFSKSFQPHKIREFEDTLQSNIHKMLVVLILRDPVDRAIAMYNHFCAESKPIDQRINATNFTPYAICGKGCLWRDILWVEYNENRKKIPSIEDKIKRFLAWIECATTDMKSFPQIYQRHFTPAADYNLIDKVQLLGRAEELGALIDILAQRLPILGTQVSNGAPKPQSFTTISPGTHIEKTRNYRNSASLNKWAVFRCYMTPEASRRVRSLYSIDYRFFGDIL